MGFVMRRILIVSIISHVATLCNLLNECAGNVVPALFIFGDSLVDVGNNFYLNTGAKANFPNGIDFGYPFGVPSGRFTNGRTSVDILGEELGIKNFTPPYLAPTTTGDVVLNGVNYASSASGIFNDTEWFFGYQTNLDEQISNYAKTRQYIISRIGIKAAKKLFERAIYVIAAGSNDVLFGKLLKSVSWDLFIDSMILRFRAQLTRLHALDAKKIVVTNSAAIGCIPFERDLHSAPNNNCITQVNQQAQLYNSKLNVLLTELAKDLKASKFIYVNVYAILEDILRNHLSYGFEVADSACCHIAGAHGGLIPCGTLSLVCVDRSKYVFWDPFHLTENAYTIIAKYMMDGDLNYIYPLNVRQLLNS